MRRKALVLMAVGLLLAVPRTTHTQTAGDNAEAENANKARVALNAMVQAMGGQAWLNMKNEMRQEHVAAFFHGQPDLGTTQIWDFHEWPDHDRVEVTKHRDVVEFYVGRQGWEVTYRGKKAMQKDILDDFLRRRDHSIETAVKEWTKDPRTILIYEGQHMVERKLGEQVTLISPGNEAVTILMDEQTHLPLSRSFEWRDPEYHDKNVDREEYDDYQVVDGFPTAFSITRFKNNEMTRQYYVDHAEYNRQLSPEFWDVDATAHKIKR